MVERGAGGKRHGFRKLRSEVILQSQVRESGQSEGQLPRNEENEREDEAQ